MVHLFRNAATQPADGVVKVDNDVEAAKKATETSSHGDGNDLLENLSPADQDLRKKLGEGAYHLPGNDHWWPDWAQYCRNNHPLLAPCFQNPLHPVSRGMRAVGLFGSLMVGLVITNVLYLWFLPSEDEQQEDVAIFHLSTGGFAVKNGTSVTFYEEDEGGVSAELAAVLADQTTVEFSNTGMAILWTVGSAVHALFDNTIWYATSCTCLDSFNACCCCCSGTVSRWVQKHRGWCNVLVILLVVLMTAGATLAVMIRAMDEATDGNGSQSAQAAWTSLQSSQGGVPSGMEGAEAVTQKENYRFLMSYSIELVFAWFVWFPIVETILFSGVLSCGGRIPGLGGRPAELREEQRGAEEEQRRNEQAAAKLMMAQKKLSLKASSSSTSRPLSPSKQRRNRSVATASSPDAKPKKKNTTGLSSSYTGGPSTSRPKTKSLQKPNKRSSTRN